MAHLAFDVKRENVICQWVSIRELNIQGLKMLLSGGLCKGGTMATDTENVELTSEQQNQALGHWDKAQDFKDLKEDAPLETMSKRDLASSFYKLGKLHYDKSDLKAAAENFVLALNLAEGPRDNFSILKTLGFLIRIASESMQNDKAQHYIEQTGLVLDELSKVLGALNAEYFYNLGLFKTYKGSFEEARDNFQFSLKKSREENDPDLQAKCLLALATNAYNLKQFAQALEYLNQLEQLLKIINKSYLNGSMHLFAAKIYMETGVFDTALDHFEKACVHLKEKKCWNLYGYILLGRGVIGKRQGHYEKALLYFGLAQEAIDGRSFKRLAQLLLAEIQDVNDSSIDLFLDRTNRKVHEKSLGIIDFKHRFVLLEILFLLAKNPGIYYDKEQLARMIWKDEYNPLIHDKLIYTSVSRLRKLIEPKGERSERRKYIVRGKDGYTFNPHVKIRFHMEGKVDIQNAIANVELSSPV